MMSPLQTIASIYCASEYALAELDNLSIPESDHSKAVKERAKGLAKKLSELLENNSYKIIMYVINYAGDQKSALPYPEQPLFERGKGYFNINGGGIVFAFNGRLDAQETFETDHQAARFQSGRFNDKEAFGYLLEELRPAFEAVSRH